MLRATVYTWGTRGYGFARDAENKEWFVSVFNVVGGKKELTPGTVIDFEPRPDKNGRPTATMVRVVEAV